MSKQTTVTGFNLTNYILGSRDFVGNEQLASCLNCVDKDSALAWATFLNRQLKYGMELKEAIKIFSKLLVVGV